MRGLPDAIDHLLAAEFRPAGSRDGVIDPLWRAARALVGGPLAWTAAERLRAVARAGGTIAVATGVIDPVRMPRGETDGPPGAAALARALAMLGPGGVVVMTEEAALGPMGAALAAAGAAGCRLQGLTPQDGSGAPARELPAADALVAVERLGPGPDGRLRTAAGTDVTAHMADLAPLAVAIEAGGGVTVGVGDLGNELGLGGLRDVAARELAQGALIGSVTPSQVPVIAACSNWGAYGIVAAIAAMERRPELLHRPDAEAAVLHACLAAGANDSAAAAPVPAVDGLAEGAHLAFCGLLVAITEFALT